MFRDCIKNHTGKSLLITEWTGVSRQDIVVIGVIAIYYNRNVYLEFLDKRMRLMALINKSKGTNILQLCHFSELSCVQHVASAQLFTWGVQSMRLVVNVMFVKFK